MIIWSLLPFLIAATLLTFGDVHMSNGKAKVRGNEIVCNGATFLLRDGLQIRGRQLPESVTVFRKHKYEVSYRGCYDGIQVKDGDTVRIQWRDKTMEINIHGKKSGVICGASRQLRKTCLAVSAVILAFMLIYLFFLCCERAVSTPDPNEEISYQVFKDKEGLHWLKMENPSNLGLGVIARFKLRHMDDRIIMVIIRDFLREVRERGIPENDPNVEIIRPE